MSGITDETLIAAVKAYAEEDGVCRPDAMEKALKAAISTLPIAGEGKVKALDEIDTLVDRLLDAQQDINFAANCKMDQSLCDASALIDDVEAFLRRIRSILSSPGKDGGQEVEAGDRFGMTFVLDEQVPSGEVHMRDADGSLLGKIVNAPAADWTCAARKQSLPEPADCDWPFCGCDPYADKVMSAIEESGRLDAQPASTALVERLAKALEPFSRIAEIFDFRGGNRPTNDSDVVAGWSDHRVNNGEDILMTVGDLREARAALAKSPSSDPAASEGWPDELKDYDEAARNFVERVRTMLGAGYGLGHHMPDLMRVLLARNEAWERLSQAAIYAAKGSGQ